MKDGHKAFSRVELVMGIAEEEAFTVEGDESGTIWRLKKNMVSTHPKMYKREGWSITSDLRTMDAKEILQIINHPESIQSLDDNKKNAVFYAINNSVIGISSQIITSLLLASSSTMLLLFGVMGETGLNVGLIIPLALLAFGVVLFGYNCYKLGEYISSNKEIYI